MKKDKHGNCCCVMCLANAIVDSLPKVNYDRPAEVVVCPNCGAVIAPVEPTLSDFTCPNGHAWRASHDA